MKPNDLLRSNRRSDERGVSPVLGVALLIAITVILAGVIAFVVLGVGTGSPDAPQASLEFSNETSDIVVDHTGGDPIDFSNVVVKTEGNAASANPTGVLEAGDTATVANNAQDGDVIKIVWENPNSEKTTVIASYTV